MCHLYPRSLDHRVLMAGVPIPLPPHPKNKRMGLTTVTAKRSSVLSDRFVRGPTLLPMGLGAEYFSLVQRPMLCLVLVPLAPPTYRVRKPSRPRNMPLLMDSSWLAVKCSSLTDEAPSNVPSSISDTLLLLRLLGEERGEDCGSPAPRHPSLPYCSHHLQV